MIDLRRRSLNLAKLKRSKSGSVRVEDLEQEIVVDNSLCEADLAEVEIEVNKKRKKKMKAELAHEMISPAASVRSNHFL